MASPNHPPAFSQNAISNVSGQINDFAGASNTMRSMKMSGTSSVADDGALRAADRRAPVPVVVTEIQGEPVEPLPGLREAMIASAIIRLVDQLPAGNPLGAEIRRSAARLYASGGEIIASYGRGDERAPKPRRPKTGR